MNDLGSVSIGDEQIGMSKLNPYRYGGKLIRDQILWDIRPVAWSSRRKIGTWRNRYRGRSAVILCNGPSLNQVDLARLNGIFTIGLNKINLLFDRSTFRPSCIVAVNPYVIEQTREFFNATELPLFLGSVGTKWVKDRGNVAFLRHGPEGFAEDCSMTVAEGYTVTYVALQLAFHMGFQSVALTGCDHRFAASGQPNMAVTAVGKDESHFDSRYFSGGARWQLPDLTESERSYLLAKKLYELRGRRIFNCTVGGALNIFERISLEEFLDGRLQGC